MVIEDTDFGELAPAMIGRFTVPTPQARLTERVYQAAAALFVSRGAHPSFGPRLVGALTAAGLEHVLAEVHAPVVSGDAAGDWVRLTVEQLRPGWWQPV